MWNFGPTLIDGINNLVGGFLDRYGEVFRAVSLVLEGGVGAVESALLLLPAVVIIGLIAAVVWYLADWRVALFGVLGLVFLLLAGLWVRTVETLALVMFSTFLALAIGIPLGIAAAWSNRLDAMLRPVLDMMQTLPSFVYLVPAVMFFGMGKVAAVIATLIFAIPPPVKLTNLGIRGVQPDLVEAAVSFGSTRWQTLFKVQVPAALPTIMAGVNQCIMLSLSMVVIASMIGAGGLGGEVLRAVQRVNIGLSFLAGIGIVIIAILLDRLLQSNTDRRGQKPAPQE